jgi:hypothetical protein
MWTRDSKHEALTRVWRSLAGDSGIGIVTETVMDQDEGYIDRLVIVGSTPPAMASLVSRHPPIHGRRS